MYLPTYVNILLNFSSTKIRARQNFIEIARILNTPRTKFNVVPTPRVIIMTMSVH